MSRERARQRSLTEKRSRCHRHDRRSASDAGKWRWSKLLIRRSDTLSERSAYRLSSAAFDRPDAGGQPDRRHERWWKLETRKHRAGKGRLQRIVSASPVIQGKTPLYLWKIIFSL